MHASAGDLEVQRGVYTELLLHIGGSHDENGSKYAVRRLWELLGKHADREDILDALESTSVTGPGWCAQQLLRLWDGGVVKNATPGYVACLCGIFRRLRLCDVLVEPCRIRIVHSLLSSGNRTKVSCGLHILRDVAEGGANTTTGKPSAATMATMAGVRNILDAVDFSLGALETIGVPPKVTGGKLMNATARDEDGVYARGLWRSGDLAKVPTRVGYVRLWLGMVRGCGAGLCARVLGLRGFTGSVFSVRSRPGSRKGGERTVPQDRTVTGLSCGL